MKRLLTTLAAARDRRAGGGMGRPDRPNRSTVLSSRLYSGTGSLTRFAGDMATGQNDMEMRCQLDRIRAEHSIDGPDPPLHSDPVPGRARDCQWLWGWS